MGARTLREDSMAHAGRGRGHLPSTGTRPGEPLPSRVPLSPSRSALGSGRQHKGRAVRTAQAREPPRLPGVVVRLPNGRSPARANGPLGHTSTHAQPLPSCWASLVPPPPEGRGFLVVRAEGEVSVIAPPILSPDWAAGVRAEPGLALEVASLFRAVLISRLRGGIRSVGLSKGKEMVTRDCDGPEAGSVPESSGLCHLPLPQHPAAMQPRPTHFACKCETPTKVFSSPAAPCPRGPCPGKSDRQSHTPVRRGR